MPRSSAEELTASFFRAGSKYPEAPRSLNSEAAQIWNDIVSSRPADFFKPGSLTLLELFCRYSAIQNANLTLLELDPTDRRALEAVSKLAGPINSYAAKLRLNIQSASRISDTRQKMKEAQIGNSNPLLGGYNNVETRN